MDLGQSTLLLATFIYQRQLTKQAEILMAYTFTLEAPALELELKTHRSRNGKDEFDPAEIRDDEWLFGEQSRIQLDSLDALQVVVALQAHFGIRLQGDRMVRKHMMNVRDLAAFIREQHSKI